MDRHVIGRGGDDDDDDNEDAVNEAEQLPSHGLLPSQVVANGSKVLI